MGELRDEVVNDPKYRLCLDHGFIGLVDHMGDDGAVIQAARVSYGKGTKTARDDRNLIRYLMRHKHTTPFEMGEVKFRVRAPIFVVRQWFRHRTSSVNEESARYSEIRDEFYFPEKDAIAPQSKDNKQGRQGELSDAYKDHVLGLLQTSYRNSYNDYQMLLGEAETGWDVEEGDDFPGIARELARVVMPVGAYTTFFWKQNLHNMLHFCALRTHPHAQAEIRAYADAMVELVQPLFPFVVEAWEDYVRQAASLSRMEKELLTNLLRPSRASFDNMIKIAGGEKAYAEERGMSLRELREFRSAFSI